MSPRLWVTRPTDSLSAISATAAATETSAVRRCGLIRGRLRRVSVAAPLQPGSHPRKSHRIGTSRVSHASRFRSYPQKQGARGRRPWGNHKRMGRVSPARLEIAAERLLALDRLEQRLEVAVAEARRAVALDHLEEDRGPVLGRLREDLQQVAVVVAVGE